MTLTITRQPAGQPTGGQFAAQAFADCDIALNGPYPIDNVLNGSLSTMTLYTNNHDTDVPTVAEVIEPALDGGLPSSVGIRQTDSGGYEVSARFDSVDLTEWAGRHLGLNPDDNDWRDEAAEWLADHYDELEAFWENHGITAEGFEYDDETLVVRTELDPGTDVTWREAGGALYDLPAYSYLSQGLSGNKSQLAADMASYLEGRPTEDLVRG